MSKKQIPYITLLPFTARKLETLEDALKDHISQIKNTYRLGVRKSEKKETEIYISVDLLREVQTSLNVKHTY